MPDKKYYREKLMKNIKAIQKYCPDFTMSEQQIEEMLSDERIEMHERMQSYEPSSTGKRLKQKIEIAKKYVPLSDIDNSHMRSFKRNYYHAVREEKTQEDIEHNRRLFTNLSRDDEMGETARTNYVVECMNSVFKIDLNKFKPGVPFNELLDYAVENSDLGGIAMENEHMLNDNSHLGMKDKKRAHDICQFGNSIGGYLREIPLYVKGENFLTFPIEYMTIEQRNKVVDSMNLSRDNNIQTDTGIDNMLLIVGIDKSRRELPDDLTQFEEEYKDRKLFNADDIEFKERDRNKRIGGGYLSRRNTALEGVEHLLNANYPIKSKKIDSMKEALTNVKTLLTEEKYLDDENILKDVVSAVNKARGIARDFTKIPEIANSNNPDIKDLVKNVKTESKTLGFFSSEGNIKDQIKYYKEDKERLAKPNELIKELNEMMAPLNMVDEFGEKETLTSGDIYELRTKMTETLQAVRAIADYPAMAPVKEKIEKQLRAMNRAVPGMTLEDALAGSARELDMTGRKFKTVGNTLSSRMMMTVTGADGSRQKGFFTKRTEFDTEKAKNELKKTLHAKYPKDIALVDSSVDFYYTDPGNNKKDEFRKAHLKTSKNADAIMKECNKIADAYITARGETLGMLMNFGEKARMDSRNVAMSDVAALIGAEDVIAKSTPMVLYDNGVKVEGTFMETARGEDIAHIHKKSPFMTVKLDCLDYSPALRQIADMQVLDYICGNMDRHAGNIFYQFDENGKITGITGIDNDESFARGTDLRNRNFTTLKGMKAISRSMVERLSTITPEMLRTSIAGNELDEEDIESAVDRLNLLKSAISDGKIQVMDDAEFTKHKLDDFLVDDKTCTFGLIKDQLEYIIKMEPEDRLEKEKATNKEAAKEETLDLFEKMDKTQLVQDIEPVDEKLRLLEDAEQSVHFGSTEFDNVKTSLRRINDANRLINANDKLASKKNYEIIQAAYDKVVRDCKKYLERKEKQGIIKDGELKVSETSKPGKRIMAVKQVLEFCNNKIQSLEESINPYHIDKAVAKIKKAKNKIIARGMIEGLDPKMAGNIIKEMNAISSNENATAKEKIFAAQQIKTVFMYVKENNINPADCGLKKQDLLNAQSTVKAGRFAYAHEHPEALRQNPAEIKVPQNHIENLIS